MADTYMAEGILYTYLDSSTITKGDPDWPQYKAECKSIREVLRIVAKHNAKQAQKKANP